MTNRRLAPEEPEEPEEPKEAETAQGTRELIARQLRLAGSSWLFVSEPRAKLASVGDRLAIYHHQAEGANLDGTFGLALADGRTGGRATVAARDRAKQKANLRAVNFGAPRGTPIRVTFRSVTRRALRAYLWDLSRPGARAGALDLFQFSRSRRQPFVAAGEAP